MKRNKSQTNQSMNKGAAAEANVAESSKGNTAFSESFKAMPTSFKSSKKSSDKPPVIMDSVSSNPYAREKSQKSHKSAKNDQKGKIAIDSSMMRGFAGTTNHIASHLIHPTSNHSSNVPQNHDPSAVNYFTRSAKNLLGTQNTLMALHNKHSSSNRDLKKGAPPGAFV